MKTTSMAAVPVNTTFTANNIEWGQCFHPAKDKNKILMRIRPVQFLLQSTLINDVINRNDIFAVDLATGNFYAMKGDTPILPIEAELLYRE